MKPPKPLISSVTSLLCVCLNAWVFLTNGRTAAAMAVACFLVLSLQLLASRKPRFAQLASSIFGLFYCGYLPSFWLKLRLLAVPAAHSALAQRLPAVLGGPSAVTVGLIAAFTAVACIIAADTGAYFFGKAFGRTRLTAVSPKKTVEGAVGGLLCSIGVAVGCFHIVAWPESALSAAALGTIVFFASLFGDLIESVIKRDAGVKDASDLIPGHGGLLDRLDSYLFTGACVFFYIRFVLPGFGVAPGLALLASGGLSYKDAGVDIDAGNELVRRIQKLNPSIGGFSGLVPFGDSYLVAGTDGVGTKLKLAFDLNKHDTVGIDLVAMSVNDIITSGAKPLFFLDYFACGKLEVIKGIVEGCRQSDCQLLGGETAEMPGFYSPGEYDLAGFAVGAVKKDAVVDGRRIAAGDVILALGSSGVHSNGFSLVRKVLEVSGTSLTDPAPWDARTSIGLSLLTPTVIYVRQVLDLLAKADIKGLVHITGGGFPENIPRVVPKGLTARVNKAAWEPLPLFRWIQEASGGAGKQTAGKVPEAEMFRTFNMGVGMIAVVDRSQVDAALAAASDAFVLGEIVTGSEGVVLA
eukprot:scaffold18.g1916.t1